jgi:hypothetical protein
MVNERREPQTCDHLLTVEFGDSDREQRYHSPWRISVHDRSRLAWQNQFQTGIRFLRFLTKEKEAARTRVVTRLSAAQVASRDGGRLSSESGLRCENRYL